MLFPKRVKFRKWQRMATRRNLRETRGTALSFGAFGLKAAEACWVNSKQIESARKAMTHYIQRGGKIWIRIFPDKPITAKPPEVTMGGGKGDVQGYVFPVLPGRILFEMDGVPKNVAEAALKRAGAKLPIRTKFVSR
ncbi:50S ribosomal protein L16 [Candidatus Giovannonibacteria bacterium RIFCSPHIGHO2_02_43_13]|uniref:Large ribosomal subunit protein uL16 n=1 Tax=Candidatus Giovannonibacteria bacterium RIFCSPHIGHO2_02_43_13 TaxID=1798330 RepID=A0A1F5WUV3_9BACT|nr:MAG: 50S ribosomal protein L16 [Parcubacteria group bacterium GW2011_GWA2_44_13]OGF71784.1 MAG: 50S ribosomal protein L16 [Candidatus Giovannonibacteria bacterium RIFCSPHIGHO2_12_FULL_44_42]OGF79383.1 MAG: 50S ribosomal protein L16 [Candidatus Giovannonibacteria bacterium RIFCSPHIGHO2_02_43_13]OGF89916.1 MAG: 50S ribosomal protein L16 [Candidatus Giovannonibacteria bacterium RIFCSPLOWO2_02_FULL_43_54]OGF97350.1 MAG: 50S ribosomal protein L16 [Candidatus Giovannonibacteria bacterium RIFCSPLOW